MTYETATRELVAPACFLVCLRRSLATQDASAASAWVGDCLTATYKNKSDYIFTRMKTMRPQPLLGLCWGPLCCGLSCGLCCDQRLVSTSMPQVAARKWQSTDSISFSCDQSRLSHTYGARSISSENSLYNWRWADPRRREDERGEARGETSGTSRDRERRGSRERERHEREREAYASAKSSCVSYYRGHARGKENEARRLNWDEKERSESETHSVWGTGVYE